MLILLTGASGMLGQNLLEHAKAKNHDWLIPSRLELDLTNAVAVESYFEKHKIDFVIHAAGLIGGIQANVREPLRFFIENLDMGRNLIMAARRAGISNLLNLSCSCMYPRATELPMREESILTGELEPTNEGYALARIATQRLCQYISTEDPKFLYKTLVACNLYGRHDKFDPSHSHMIPAVIVKLHEAKLKKSPQVEIWGNGHALREFMFVTDLATCILMAVENFETFPSLANAGTGTEYSINQYYEKIASVVGFTGSFVHDLSKPSGMARKIVDSDRLRLWGWRAETSLEEGLRLAYEYFLQEPYEFFFQEGPSL